MTYFEKLVANGTSPEHARVLVQIDELDRFAVREHPNYGRFDPNPPSAEDVRQAYEFKFYGVERDAD